MKQHEEVLSYTVVVTDKRGKELKRVSAPSKSYVQQWNQIINVGSRPTGELIKDTDGVNRNSAGHASNLSANAAIGIDDNGIRVGRGTTAVAITDYALETPCDEGVGLNQLEHQAMQFTEPAVAGSTCSFTAKRTLINNSGADIIGVKELGCYIGFSASAWYAMGFRDLLGTAVDVPDGGAITVEYTIGATA